MTLDDIRRLNIREVGNWPLLPKLAILLLLFIVIVGAGFLLDWKDQWDALELAQVQPVDCIGQATDPAACLSADSDRDNAHPALARRFAEKKRKSPVSSDQTNPIHS